jgi:hypothetical protein
MLIRKEMDCWIKSGNDEEGALCRFGMMVLVYSSFAPEALMMAVHLGISDLM